MQTCFRKDPWRTISRSTNPQFTILRLHRRSRTAFAPFATTRRPPTTCPLRPPTNSTTPVASQSRALCRPRQPAPLLPQFPREHPTKTRPITTLYASTSRAAPARSLTLCWLRRSSTIPRPFAQPSQRIRLHHPTSPLPTSPSPRGPLRMQSYGKSRLPRCHRLVSPRQHLPSSCLHNRGQIDQTRQRQRYLSATPP